MRLLRSGTGPVLAIACAAVAYACTLAPSVGAGDSGELILAANALGVPHPPGYPLWTLLARLATLLPWGEVAWRVNALSAALASLGAGLFYFLARRVGLRALGAGIATALYAGSTIVWGIAVETEVYALVAIFFLLLALFAFRARSAHTAGVRSDALFFFTAGLSILVHQTLLFPAAILGGWVLARRASPRRAAVAACWTLLGASLVLFLPIRWAAHPAFFWGGEAGWRGVMDGLLRRSYGAIRQNPLSASLALDELLAIGLCLVRALGIPGALLVLGGAWRGGRSRGQTRIVAAASGSIAVALLSLVAFTPDAEHVAQIAPFLIPVVASAAVLAGAGVDAILARGSKWYRRSAAGMVAALVLATLVSHGRECDRSEFRLAERYGRDLFRDLPADAILIVDGDNETFLAAYASRMEGVRPDVTLIHRKGYLFGDPYGLAGVPRSRWIERAHAVDLERLASTTRPVCYSTPPPDLAAAGVRFVPAGLVSRALPPEAAKQGTPRHGGSGAEVANAWTPQGSWPWSSDLLPGGPERYDYVTRKLAVSYSDVAAQALWNSGHVRESLPWFEDAARVGFDFPEAHLNLASASAAAGKPERAIDELLTARALAPRSPEPAARLAVFLAAAGRHREAALWFERAYRLSPNAALAADAARAWKLAGDGTRARYWTERIG
jgi:hypothetical protein